MSRQNIPKIKYGDLPKNVARELKTTRAEVNV